MSDESEAPEEGWRVLEVNERFSRSVLWTLMKEYYDRKGPTAWHGEVPNYSTCNTFIAKSYAEVVMAYLHELTRTNAIDTSQPVYIVELAAGIGAFAHYFLHAFGALKEQSSLRGLDVRYLMTDFTQSNLKAWREHPDLLPFLKGGLLDIGKFDVDTDDAIELANGSLTAGSCKNPIVILANYAFDTFRNDIFCVERGQLNEVGLTSRAPTTEPIELAQVQTRYAQRSIDPSSYYDEPLYNQLLADYRALLVDATFMIPVGSLRALDRLLDVSGGRGLLLSSDKGFTHVDELFQPNPQAMQLHGSFSVMVNYHAIGRYAALRGGVYSATSTRMMSLKTAMCVFSPESAPFVDTLSTFRRRIDQFGPGEFFEFFRVERTAQKSVEQIISLLRLSGYDPALLYNYSHTIREQCRNLPDWVVFELRSALERTWRNYFIGPGNLPFELARILLGLGQPLEAARFNQIAIDCFGELPAAYLNMGICYYNAENPQQALVCFERAAALDPELGPPREWIARIAAERGRRLPPSVVRPRS